VAYALAVVDETDEGGVPQTYLKLFLALILQSGLSLCMKKLNLSTRIILGVGETTQRLESCRMQIGLQEERRRPCY